MKKLLEKFTYISLIVLSFTNCQNPSSNKPITQNWSGETSTIKYDLTLTQKDSQNFNFTQKITTKANNSVTDSSGIVNYIDTQNSVWTYTKPAAAVVKSTYTNSNNGNRFEYTVTESNSTFFLKDQKYVYTKK